MARTHAAGTVRFHQDDGVVLGKGGVPIPTTPTRGIPQLYPHGQPVAVKHMDEGELVIPTPKPEPVAAAPTGYEWRCDPSTWGRSLDGFQALHLLNAMLKRLVGIELSVVLTDEEARKLPADTRWHFKRQIADPNRPIAPPVALAPEPEAAPQKPARLPRAQLTEAFDNFALAAMAVGGHWTAIRLRQKALEVEGTGVTADCDLRSLTVRLMGLRRRKLIESLGKGYWRIAESARTGA